VPPADAVTLEGWGALTLQASPAVAPITPSITALQQADMATCLLTNKRQEVAARRQ
jgi:hypothetical protein